MLRFCQVWYTHRSHNVGMWLEYRVIEKSFSAKSLDTFIRPNPKVPIIEKEKWQDLSKSSKEIIENRVTFYSSISRISMMTTTPSKSFAIYQTQQGIELLSNQDKPIDAELICLVSHYQSAVRIAHKVAQVRKISLVTSTTWNIGSTWTSHYKCE